MNRFLAFLLLFVTATTFAHGDLDARIKKVSKQIEKNPNNPALYIKRGELYYQHEEYKRSLIDFERAKALGYQSTDLDILFARSYFKAGKHQPALDVLNTVLKSNQAHVVSNRLTGQILHDQGDHSKAIKYLQRALELSQKKTPEHYLELSDVYLSIGTSESTVEATAILEAGTKELGELIVLLQKLVGIYKNNQDYVQALAAQSRIINISIRKEIPLFDRAQLYYYINNFQLAIQDLDGAEKAIVALPRRISRTDEIQKISSGINRLKQDIYAKQ